MYVAIFTEVKPQCIFVHIFLMATPLFYLVLIAFISEIIYRSSFTWKSYWEIEGKGKNRYISHVLVHSQMATVVRDEWPWEKEVSFTFPIWVQEPKTQAERKDNHVNHVNMSRDGNESKVKIISDKKNQEILPNSFWSVSEK